MSKCMGLWIILLEISGYNGGTGRVRTYFRTITHQRIRSKLTTSKFLSVEISSNLAILKFVRTKNYFNNFLISNNISHTLIFRHLLQILSKLLYGKNVNGVVSLSSLNWFEWTFKKNFWRFLSSQKCDFSLKIKL